jgi:HTH-type transcriptional regulator / antitoxin HigA
MHELGHIEMHLGKNNDREFIDLYGKGIVKNDKEIEADNYAKGHLISPSEWEDFIKNYAPYTDEKILRFSEKYEMHPYIIFGRISHEMNFFARKTDINKEIKY